MKKEYLEVVYSFTGDDYIRDLIPAAHYKAFKDSFLKNECFIIKYDRTSQDYRSGLNEKVIDMSKVKWIGF